MMRWCDFIFIKEKSLKIWPIISSIPYELISRDQQWIIRKPSWCLCCCLEVIPGSLNVFHIFPSWGARAGSSKGSRCYHYELCHNWTLGSALLWCPRAAEGVQLLLLCSQCGWEHTGEILKSSVLVREVNRKHKKKWVLILFLSRSLSFSSGSDWRTYLDLRLWNLLLKHPPLVIAGVCRRHIPLLRNQEDKVSPTHKTSYKPLLCCTD